MGAEYVYGYLLPFYPWHFLEEYGFYYPPRVSAIGPRTSAKHLYALWISG